MQGLKLRVDLHLCYSDKIVKTLFKLLGKLSNYLRLHYLYICFVGGLCENTMV